MQRPIKEIYNNDQKRIKGKKDGHRRNRGK